MAYIISPLVLHIIPIPLLSRISAPHPKIYGFIHLVLSLIPPTIIAYSLLFMVGRKSSEDFEDRVWEAERERGLTAGKDKDKDGKIEIEERIRESAEWLNALLRGVWPIINTNMFVISIPDKLHYGSESGLLLPWICWKISCSLAFLNSW